MDRTLKFVGALALAATSACSSDSTGPGPSATSAQSIDRGSSGSSSSSTSNTVVTESDIARQIEDTPPTRSWVFYTRATTPATGTFITGPGTPPPTRERCSTSIMSVPDSRTSTPLGIRPTATRPRLRQPVSFRRSTSRSTTTVRLPEVLPLSSSSRFTIPVRELFRMAYGRPGTRSTESGGRRVTSTACARRRATSHGTTS
jgi:hypothetical protein